MEILIILVLVGFLCLLAIFDLFIGVSNDAVNFLNSAVGSRVASFTTVLVIASAGIILGALMSSGMMDIARHGVMHPSLFTLMEVFTIFLAVMATDIIVIDRFNSWGLPTSTTVSLVFELLGATLALSGIKMLHDPSLSLSMLCNSEKALQMIVAIFVSVMIAFVVGTAVQWIVRLTFSFRYGSSNRLLQAIFGTLSFCVFAYFIVVKGIGNADVLPPALTQWTSTHMPLFVSVSIVVLFAISCYIVFRGIGIFRVIVLLGTFALAMAFASNDLVNFIGVPMAGISSLQAWYADGYSDPTQFMMTSLEDHADSPSSYLLLAALIMIIAIATSKKAKHVVQTSVNLGRQDESDEMFGSSRAAQGVVSLASRQVEWLTSVTPQRVKTFINSRFIAEPLPEGVAFDEVRAAVNLVLASSLIVIGTLWQLPLSTTYVTFMVAMGSSLADRAWGRESAVFRITGVMSVVGGWFLTAILALCISAIVCSILYYGGLAAIVAVMIIIAMLMIKSHRSFTANQQESAEEKMEGLMLRCRDESIVQDLLRKYMRKQQSSVASNVRQWYKMIANGLLNNDTKPIRAAMNEINKQKRTTKRSRRCAFLALKRTERDYSLERTTWLHLAYNADQQWLYCLQRMAEPAIEHIANSFRPLPQHLADEYKRILSSANELLKESAAMIDTGRYEEYALFMAKADLTKHQLSQVRSELLRNMQAAPTTSDYNISLVYLNYIQETQEMLSIMRHQLRATRKFVKQQ